MTPDIVTEVVGTLTSAIETISAVKKKTMYMYDQDDLLSLKKKLGLPAIGVVYVGMRGKDDSSKTGLAVEILCDIYLVGGEQCTSKIGTSDEKPKTTALLDEIRSAIKCTTAPGNRKWKFVFELPADFSEDVLAYVQRWSTTLILTG